jgi:hypothetical protein
MQHLMSDAGFDLDGVIASLEFDRNGYAPREAWRLTNELIQRLGHIPPVLSASASTATLLGSPGMTVQIAAKASPSLMDPGTMITMNAVTPGYFSTLGTSIIRGREFLSTDVAGSKLVAIVDEGLAKNHWPGRDPIGQCVYLGCARTASKSSASLSPGDPTT